MYGKGERVNEGSASLKALSNRRSAFQNTSLDVPPPLILSIPTRTEIRSNSSWSEVAVEEKAGTSYVTTGSLH